MDLTDFSSKGATALQGPHQVAKASTRMGFGDSLMSLVNSSFLKRVSSTAEADWAESLRLTS